MSKLTDYFVHKRWIHGTDQAYWPREWYEQQVEEWQACDFAGVKLLESGGSQVETCQKLRDKFHFVIRPYANDAPDNHLTADYFKPYVDAGVLVFESSMNEFYASYENKWKMKLPDPRIPDWPEQVAHGWAMQAVQVLAAGGIPTTPAIETWNYDSIFVPLFTVLVDHYGNLLRECIVALHNRTLNHPCNYQKDPGCYLGWVWVDKWLREHGLPNMPIIATEAGPEPGWDQDTNYPQVTPQLHADMVRSILEWPTPDNYLADCFWLWYGQGGFAGASWKWNGQWTPEGGDRSLPVVAMLKGWKQPRPFVELTDRQLAEIGTAKPSEVRINHTAALYRALNPPGRVLEQIESNEWHEAGYILQKSETEIAAIFETDAKAGTWHKVRVVGRLDK